MKRIILSLTLILSIAVSAFAIEKTNPRIESEFKKQFVGAENVQWSAISEGIARVSFTWSGTRAEAYFDETGELLGTQRSIFYSQVPFTVSRAISNRFKSPTVLSVSEITTNGGTRYSLLVEQGTKRFKTQLTNTGEIMEVTRVKK